MISTRNGNNQQRGLYKQAEINGSPAEFPPSHWDEATEMGENGGEAAGERHGRGRDAVVIRIGRSQLSLSMIRGNKP